VPWARVRSAGRSFCKPSKTPPSTLGEVLQAPQPQPRSRLDEEGGDMEVRLDTIGIYDIYIYIHMIYSPNVLAFFGG